LGSVVLAYHKPGARGAEALVEALAARLGARAAPLEAAPESCARGGLIVALLPARGGHLASLASEAWRSGCRLAGPIPPSLVGSYAAYELSRHSCGEGFLVYWRAKRLRGLQDHDMKTAAIEASRRLGSAVEALPYTPNTNPRPPSPGACVVVATLLPGRLPRLLQGLGWRVVGSSMLESSAGWRLVSTWLASIILPAR
jgi:hypothetical protein